VAIPPHPSRSASLREGATNRESRPTRPPAGRVLGGDDRTLGQTTGVSNESGVELGPFEHSTRESGGGNDLRDVSQTHCLTRGVRFKCHLVHGQTRHVSAPPYERQQPTLDRPVSPLPNGSAQVAPSGHHRRSTFNPSLHGLPAMRVHCATPQVRTNIFDYVL